MANRASRRGAGADSGGSAAAARAALFCAVIARIPRGRVASYGQIAALVGLPRHARHVGAALRDLDDDDAVPWHRVVSSSGRVSPRDDPAAGAIQRALLEAEGVRFDARGRIDLRRFAWRAGP